MSLSDGSKYKGGFTDGVVDGKGIIEEADGTRLEGEFQDGLRTGTFTVRDKSGKNIRTIIY
jgi:hypothetical protein